VKSRAPKTRCGLLVGLLLAAPAAAQSDAFDILPADTLLAWKGEPHPDRSASSAPASSQPSALATLVDAGTRIAGSPLAPKHKLALRLVEALAAATHRRFAIAVLDAQARPTPSGGFQVEKLQFAVIVRTEGDSAAPRRLIQKIVNEMTDGGLATLDSLRAGDRTYEQLRDRRLDEPIAWGELGPFFVLTYGPDVWPRIAKVADGDAAALSKVGWLAEARKKGRPGPLIEIAASVAEIRARLDPLVGQRATAFFEAWHALDIDHALWTLGFRENALYCHGWFEQGGKLRQRVFADSTPEDAARIKPLAGDSRFALYQSPLGTLLPRFFSGYFATRSATEKAAAERVWLRMQKDLGFDPQRDLFDKFGDTILLHNDPPHPLAIPLAFTAMIPIRGEADELRRRIDSICAAWSAWLEEDGDGWTRMVRDGDGVWSFQFGPLAVLSWQMTDRYLVTCWSPAALRDYIERRRGELQK
jgi:hypothetical protein